MLLLLSRGPFITPLSLAPSLPLTPLQFIDWLKKVSATLGYSEAIEESIQQIEIHYYIEHTKREKQGEGLNECTPLLGHHSEE